MVVSLTGFRPTPRYDDVPWTKAQIHEAVEREGPYTLIETITLDPVEPDPAAPMLRNLTTAEATLNQGWYIVAFEDDAANADPSEAVFNGPDDTDLYPSLATLLSDSTVDELLNLDGEQQATLRLSSIKAIEAYCNQAFVPYSGTLEARSENQYEVYMPRRLRAIVSIVPWGGEAMELDAVRIEGDGVKIRFERSAVATGYYSQALYEVSGGDYAVGFKQGTLLIDGDWGWEDTPAEVELALRYDMEEQALADANALSATTHAFRRMGLNAVGQGNLSAQLAAPPTLSPRVERLVQPHLWLGPGGRLV